MPSDRPHDPARELAELGRRLRSAIEIQGILLDHEEVVRAGRSGERGRRAGPPPAAPSREPPPPPGAAAASGGRFPSRAGRSGGPAPREASSPPPETPAPPPRRAPEPAGVIAAGPAPQGPDLFAAPVRHPWEGDPAEAGTLGELHERFEGCLRCPLGETRTNFVFGVGNPNATVMFVGEAPGRDEDLQGEPFVGRAGKLLDRILEAIGWRREEVYIANILKCRPPGNRNPEAVEIAACEPILRRQIQLVAPRILCTLGSTAAKTLLGTSQGITKLRGHLHRYGAIPVVATYHPAALLRNPHWKRPTWEDVQMLRREHDRLLRESESSRE